MSASRRPGPLGVDPGHGDPPGPSAIDDRWCRPGPVGEEASATMPFHGHPSPLLSLPLPPRRQVARAGPQELRHGSQGPEVQRLQRQLNARSTPSPGLRIDGVFGPVTHLAVLRYQQGLSLPADGIAGKRTWYHLLRGDRADVPGTSTSTLRPASAGVSSSAATTARPSAVGPSHVAPAISTATVGDWPLQDKFAAVLRRTAPRLPGDMRHEFEALLSPTGLAVMAGTLVVWAGSHAFGVGAAVDVALLIGGAFFLGMTVFEVVDELGSFLVATATADDERDLDEAAIYLARAIAVMGVAAFVALLARVGAGRKGGRAAPETPPKPPKPEPASKKAAPAPVEPKPQPVDRADANNAAAHEAYKNKLRASMEKPAVSDKELSRLIDPHYRPNAKTGSGSTAAAVREELATGQPVGGKFHSQKARDGIVALQKWLDRNPNARPGDRAAAENIIRDMTNALEGH